MAADPNYLRRVPAFWVGRGGLVALAIILVGCSGSPSATPSATAAASGTSGVQPTDEEAELVVAGFGGPFGDAQREFIFDPFEEETGIRVVVAEEPSLAQLKTMVESETTTWDVAQLTQGEMFRAVNDDLLTPIDYGQISQDVQDGLYPSVRNEYGVGVITYAQVLGWNTETYPDQAPSNWADMWDLATFPGPRSLAALNLDIPPLEVALLADGVAPEDLYPLDIDRGYESLARICRDVTSWELQGAELVASGEIAMSWSASGRWFSYIDEGAPVDLSWDQALVYADDWVIPSGAPHPSNAHRFLEFQATPEIQAAFSAAYPNAPANGDAVELLTDEQRARLPAGDNLATAITVDAGWWAETDSSGQSNQDKVASRWETFLAEDCS